MGGRAHSKGSEKVHANVMAESRKVKKHMLKYIKKGKNWSAPKIAAYLDKMNILTWQHTKFSARRVRGHMERLGLLD